MVSRIIILRAFIGTMLLWLGPLPVPDWVVIAFLAVGLVPLSVALAVRRMRIESRLARTLWMAVTRK